MPPEQLAWGSRVLRQDALRQEALVAAIRKESLQPWVEIFLACGITLDFTVAALWRAAGIEPPPGSCALLHLGRRQLELLIYEDGFPAALRVLNWGRDTLSAATAAGIDVSKIYFVATADAAPAAQPGRDRLRLAAAEGVPRRASAYPALRGIAGTHHSWRCQIQKTDGAGGGACMRRAGVSICASGGAQAIPVAPPGQTQSGTGAA